MWNVEHVVTESLLTQSKATVTHFPFYGVAQKEEQRILTRTIVSIELRRGIDIDGNKSIPPLARYAQTANQAHCAACKL